MKRLSEYITEWISSGRTRYHSFPKDTDLKDNTELIDFLESMGFYNATGNTDVELMPSILSTFKKSNKPVYVLNEYHIDGAKSYWLRFFNAHNNTRNITENNPIFTISYNASHSGSGSVTYYIEKTVGDETIKQVTREEFMGLLDKHFGWK
jgi:hypothetical protein